MDQRQKKVFISHAAHRTYGHNQWLALRETLGMWKGNLSLVKDSIQAIVSAPLTAPVQ